MTTELNSSTVLSLLDDASGFLQISLDKGCWEITFWTPLFCDYQRSRDLPEKDGWDPRGSAECSRLHEKHHSPGQKHDRAWGAAAGGHGPARGCRPEVEHRDTDKVFRRCYCSEKINTEVKGVCSILCVAGQDCELCVIETSVHDSGCWRGVRFCTDVRWDKNLHLWRSALTLGNHDQMFSLWNYDWMSLISLMNLAWTYGANTPQQ